MEERSDGGSSDDKESLKEETTAAQETGPSTSMKPHLDISNWFDELTDEDFNSMDTLLYN